jgi:glycerate-2-kinase
VEGCRRIIELADSAEAADLVVCLISGGGSSLLPLPVPGISLADKQVVTTLLLKSGATISDVNTVRKHLSGIKGGWLARRVYPARLLNLILSDVIGDQLDVIASGPTVPDTTTFADAVAVLQRYSLWYDVPETVRGRLSDGVAGQIEETPKPGDVSLAGVLNRIVGNNHLALVAASNSLAAAGFKVEVVKEPWQGDACQLGQNLAARAIAAAGSAVPVAVLMGGEATVQVAGHGRGGRNQQAALAAVRELAGHANLLVALLATDGIDGPTDACGALVDGTTLARAQKLAMTPETFLQNNDSYSFFKALGDLVHTGYTGSNVNDIYMILSAGSSAR